MKLNGKNIITDQDVTITGANNLGGNLSDILQSQQNELNSLKSNVKWLYKYGGVGGSGGGGGSSASNWGIFATLDNKTIVNNGTISLNESQTIYSLVIQIKNGNGSYNAEYFVEGSQNGRKVVLSPENGWKVSVSVTLNTNSFISIQVTDGSDIKSLMSDYIRTPYSFNDLRILEATGAEYPGTGDKDIMIETAREKGLVISCPYFVAVKAETTYKWTYLDRTTEPEKLTDKSGNINLEFPREYLTEDLAGLYFATLDITITPENQEPEKITKIISFNLIPKNLYLKVSPEQGIIYDSIQEGEYFSYKVNRDHFFTLRVYCGSNQGRNSTISYGLYDLEDNILFSGTPQIVLEQEDAVVKISSGYSGWAKLRFSVSIENNTEIKEVEKYLNLVEAALSLNWYNSGITPPEDSNSHAYYRMSLKDGLKNIQGLPLGTNNTAQSYYTFSANEDATDTILKGFLTGYQGEGLNTVVHVGIQYNYINDTSKKILSFNYNSDNTEKEFISIYQNKIVIDDSSLTDIDIFLRKEVDYDPTNPENYHLISIVFKYSKTINGAIYREVLAYIDGVVVGATTNLINYYKIISSVTLHNSNYSINLLETAIIDTSYIKDGKTMYRSIDDIDINYYYLTYYGKSTQQEESQFFSELDKTIMDSFYEKIGDVAVPIPQFENQLIKVNAAFVTSVSKSIKIPSLVAKVNREVDISNQLYNIFYWMNNDTYDEQGSADNDSNAATLQGYYWPAELRWYAGNKSGALDATGLSLDDDTNIINGKNLYDDSNYSFYLRLQGSSTMKNKSKNFTLGVKNDTDNTKTAVFSPNFNPDPETGKDTFLPDRAFTLKADIVDSSHANNVSIGKFINENHNFSLGYGDTGLTGTLLGHVKKCLTGFPILLFLEINKTKDKDGNEIPTEYYFLGSYNFNIGRENGFNLGYLPLNLLEGVTSATDEQFSYGLINGSIESNRLPNLGVAEIQGNSGLFDFSQYQQSILFESFGSKEYMFGDLVNGSGFSVDDLKVKIQDFVKSVAGAGGYVFTRLGKKFETIRKSNGTINGEAAYHKINTVPDTDIQVSRNSDGSSLDLVPEGSSGLNPKRSELNVGNIRTCILETEAADNSQIFPYLDYESLVYYYTTCMAFGLVDSVQKNMNIKTWNGKTFGIYFYDMDTSLGLDNTGLDYISFFCFSDYWETNEEKAVDEDGEELDYYMNNGTIIHRDYYPEKTEENPDLPLGYDIPSSYLFALAKYASCFNSFLSTAEEQINLLTPQSLWASWRAKDGILETAEKFVKKYFAGHLDDIPNSLINLNYRNKYLFPVEGTTLHLTSSPKLKGRRLEKTIDWLEGRFRLLDAYFNLSNITTEINKAPDGTSYYESSLNDTELTKIRQNPDVYILRDIFSSNGATVQRNGLVDFKVKAVEYSPLIITSANTANRYLLKDNNKIYSIQKAFSTQTSTFGGSALWTYLESLNSFITSLTSSGVFYLESDKLDNIEGTSGTLTGAITLKTPAAKKITMKSPNYSGMLTVDGTFYNLLEMDLSKSKISLDLTNNITIKKINLSEITSSDVTINGCTNLKTVNFTGANITNKLTIGNLWEDVKSKITFSGTNPNVGNLVIVGSGGDLVIDGVPDLNSVNYSNFRTVTINNCEKLQSVSESISADYRAAQTIQITKCSKLNTASIRVSNSTRSISLRECSKLSGLTLNALSTDTNPFGSLTTLDLTYTSVTKINYPETISSSDGVDIRPLTNLVNFNISNNKAVEYVYVNYAQDKPFVIGESNKECFKGCAELKRVYGHIKIDNVTEAFKDCFKFSIHGYLLESGKAVLRTKDGQTIKYRSKTVTNPDGRVLHPLEISEITDTTRGNSMKFQTDSNATNITFFGSNSTSGTFQNTSCTIFDMYYVFQNLYDSTTYNCSNLFCKGSSAVTGDALKFKWSSTCDNSPSRRLFETFGHKITNLSSALRATCNTVRIFPTTYNNDGSIKEKGVFYWLTNATSLSTIFLGGTLYTDKDVFKIKGDTSKITSIAYFQASLINGISTRNYNDIFDSNGLFKLDYLKANYENIGDFDGIFNHLPLLTSLTNCFVDTAAINYNKFNLGLSKAKLSTIVYSFTTNYATGEIKLNSIFKEAETNGVLYDISQSFLVYKSITDLSIGKSNPVLKINNDLFKYFPKLQRIGYRTSSESIDIVASRQNAEYSSFTGNITKIIDSVEFPYEIFSHLTNLTRVSCLFKGASWTNGENKTVYLPGNMFKNNTNLKDIPYLFADLPVKIELTDPLGKDEYANFTNCPNLNDVSHLFEVSKRWSESFLKTKGIQSMIPYKFFYHGKNTDTTVILSGTNDTKEISLDNNLSWEKISDNQFRHTKLEISQDENDNTITIKTITTFTGIEDPTESSFKCLPTTKISVTVEKYLKEKDNVEVGDGELIESNSTERQAGNDANYFTVESISHKLTSVKATISNMADCFKGQGNIKEYAIAGNNKEDEQAYVTKETEGNPDYSPFNFIYIPTTKKWTDNRATRNTKEKTYMWIYDGANSSYYNPNGDFDSYQFLDEDIKGMSPLYAYQQIIVENEETGKTETINSIDPIDGSGFWNFSCPPDLFRYCTSNAKISGMFNGCGYNGQVRPTAQLDNPLEFGIKGRICPYLLKPVSGCEDISYMFFSCKNINGYYDNNDEVYLIPKTFLTYAPKIINLSYAFGEMNWPWVNIDVNGTGVKKFCKLNIFDTLTGYLNVTGTFSKPLFAGGVQGDLFPVEDVFIKNSISRAVGTFTIGTCEEEFPETTNYVHSQYVRFGPNFTKKAPTGMDANGEYLVNYVYADYTSTAVLPENKANELGVDSGKKHNYRVK